MKRNRFLEILRNGGDDFEVLYTYHKEVGKTELSPPEFLQYLGSLKKAIAAKISMTYRKPTNGLERLQIMQEISIKTNDVYSDFIRSIYFHYSNKFDIHTLRNKEKQLIGVF